MMKKIVQSIKKALEKKRAMEPLKNVIEESEVVEETHHHDKIGPFEQEQAEFRHDEEELDEYDRKHERPESD